MKLQLAGKTLPLKNLDSGRLRDIYELQQQTGWTLKEIREHADGNEIVTSAVIVFLSANAAGTSMTWDEVLNLSYNDVRVVSEPGDTARGKKAKADPQKPSGDSSPGDVDQAEAATEG